MTVGEALAAAAVCLQDAGIGTAELDAELLVRHVLGWDRAALLMGMREALAPNAAAELCRLTEARARRRPLQHLVGTQAFWRHEFVVTGDVLIPRPETELLVEEALRALESIPVPVVVDVGTGSGCIALSLALERPDAIVHAVDVSAAALGVARENARRLGQEHRVHFHEANLLSPWAGQVALFHLIASNPPYVAADEVGALAPEVRDHEPRIALVPPGGTLSIYERLCPAAAGLLLPGGHLVMEVGAGQADAVSALARAAGFALVKVASDLQGIPRTVVAQKP